MHREAVPIVNLALWAKFNNIQLNCVEVSSLPEGKGSGVIAISAKAEEDAVLMTVPQELILSLENVWIYAKADQHLHQVLEAVDDYSRTARGAILIFLLLQVTNGATQGKIGVQNPFTEYIKFLPTQIPVPTFWNESERAMLTGTSLEGALEAKLNSLDREFSLLRDSTCSIGWCQRHWWDTETGRISFEDWKMVDAMYRSRALDLPGTGHATVPVLDMANHASGEETTALYGTNADGNAIMILRDGKKISPGDEVTITYGDEKGACEMLFSYGFIEPSMTSAKEIFLDLEIPEDDPLRFAKKAIAKTARGFRAFEKGNSIGWEGSFVWLLCVNEEDGLEFKILQSTEGKRELEASWKERELTNVSELPDLLAEEKLWNVFKLRAITVLQARVAQQLLKLESSKQLINEIAREEESNSSIANAMRLRDLEETLMLHSYEDFETQKMQLLDSAIVQEYLGSVSNNEGVVPQEEEFA